MQKPTTSVASSPGTLAIITNPANLAFSPSTEFLYLHQERLSFDMPSGGADGIFLRAGKIGFGLQWIRPFSDDDQWDYIKYSLALPLVQADWFSTGIGLEILDPTNTSESAALDFMFGITARPWRYLSFGAVGRNLGKASLAGQSSPYSVEVGLAIRPLWFAPERATLGVDTRLQEDNSDPDFRFSGIFRIIDGISLFGNLDLNGNFGIGLSIDFQKIGIGSHFNYSDQAGAHDNALLAMRFSTENQPGFIISDKRTAQLDLSSNLSSGHKSKIGILGKRVSLENITQAILMAAKDKRVDSLLIKIEDPKLSWTDVEELREVLAQFKEKNKKVFFHLQHVNNINYYLASSADAIYLAPGGIFHLVGPTVEASFLAGTLEILGINPQTKRIGKYKSAIEQLTNKEPSEGYLEVMNSLVDEYANQLYDAVAAGRKMTREKVIELIDRGIIVPSDAVDAGLADGIVHFDELDKLIDKKLKHRPALIKNYLTERWTDDRWGSKPLIAVVHAEGTISYNGAFSGLNAKMIAHILERLRFNSSVDAVILRVDSPGGSSMASELIWNQVAQLQKVKPVIVSMANYAASGGYYISCPADSIVANPLTVTGSIGVYSILFDLTELYAKIGLSHKTIKRNTHADFASTHRTRSPDEMKRIEDFVQAVYQEFIGKVAEGRDRSTEEIDNIAQGRIWTGRQAKEKGLVDELGGYRKALSLTRQKLGINLEDPVNIVHLPKPSFSLAMLLQELGISTSTSILPAPINRLFQELSLRLELSEEPALSLLPVVITIK
jgi:protease-4